HRTVVQLETARHRAAQLACQQSIAKPPGKIESVLDRWRDEAPTTSSDSCNRCRGCADDVNGDDRISCCVLWHALRTAVDADSPLHLTALFVRCFGLNLGFWKASE